MLKQEQYIRYSLVEEKIRQPLQQLFIQFKVLYLIIFSHIQKYTTGLLVH